MRRVLPVATALVAVFLLCGCELAIIALVGESTRDDPPPAPTLPYGGEPLEVESGFLAGSLGGFDDIEGDAYEIEGYENQVILHTGARGGDDHAWAMIGLTIDEGFSSDALAPGAHFEVGPDVDPSSGVYISALGCTGPEHGNFDYDAPAQQVTVDVFEGTSPDTRIVAFTATFDDAAGARVATGEFEYRPLR